MKRLLILRHGKAEPEGVGGDRGRVLTPRGRQDAKRMGQKVGTLVGPLDRVLTSNANRARETAEIASASAGYSGQIDVESELYGADLYTLLDVLGKLPEATVSLLVVGHNPGLEELCEDLLPGGTALPPLVTAGLVDMELDIERWRDLRSGCARLRGAYSPKDED